LFAVAVIFAAGAAVFCAIVREPLRYLRMERLAYCYPLGLTALGMPMFLLSYWGFQLNTIAIPVAVSVALVVVIVVRKVSLRQFCLTRAESETSRQPLGEFEWLLVVILVLCLGARTLASLLAPLNDWDGICVWGIKAKVLYFDTVQTTDYFNRPELAFSHPNYPLLWPFMYAWVCTVLGKWDDLGMLILNPINLIVFTVLLYGALRKYVVRAVALGVTVIMASLPALLHYAECGQADVPLMLISGAALFCLFDWMNERRMDSLLLAAFLMGGALFTKQEGKIILIAQGCAGALSVWLGNAPAYRKRYLGQLVLFVCIALLWASPWLLFERGIKDWSWDYSGVSLTSIRWGQIPALLGVLVANAVQWNNQVHLAKWNIFWPLIAFCLITNKAVWRSPWNCLLVVFAIHAAGIACVLLASRWDMTLLSLEIALERFAFVMMTPLYMILAKCADDAWAIWKGSATTDELLVSDAGAQRATAR
jgi:hypothetical protein